jgi:hypothetical protein
MRSKSERLRRLKLGDLRRLLRIRCGHTLPDDDAGREYLWELLLLVSQGPEPDLKMPNIIQTWAKWMDNSEAAQIIDQINRIPIYQRRRTGRQFGEYLNIPNAEREAFKLWRFIPFDMTDQQMKELRKAKDRAGAQCRRRVAGAKPRERALSRRKPWLTAGISRATWYRKNGETNTSVEQQSHRETNTSATKLLLSKRRTCLTVQTEKPKGLPTSSQGVEAESINSTEQAENTEQIPLACSADETVSRGPFALGDYLSHEDLRGRLVINGFAISATPEDRKPLEPGQIIARVWIREIRHPAIKSGPDDDLDDFKIAARMR